MYKGTLVKDLPRNADIVARKVKRQARYWCFRFKSEADGGSSAKGRPPLFKEYIEGLEGFGGWHNFAVTWDIEGANPFKIFARDFSVWEEWNAVMRRVAKPLPGTEEEEIGGQGDIRPN